MTTVQFDVSLTLRGPVLTRSSVMGAYGLDAPAARDQNGQCYLPGTLVKGKLLQAWEELRSANAVDSNLDLWLGKASGNRNTEGPVQPRRGLLHFSDFAAARPGDRKYRYRIAMNHERGCVDEGDYQVMESPFAPGEEIVFNGTVRCVLPPDRPAADLERDLRIGLRWITALGSERTLGFGCLLKADVTMRPVDQRGSAGATLHFAISPRSPFCVSKHRLSDNLFESEEVIPGGSLKGCVASLLQVEGGQGPGDDVSAVAHPHTELRRHFHAVRFTHAFPAAAARPMYPRTVPLSVARAGDEFYDVLGWTEPRLFNNRAPAFDIDWKSDGPVSRLREKFGWPQVSKEIRVRTAIESIDLRARDGALFAYEMVRPTPGLVWMAKVDLCRIKDAAERTKVETQLREVLAHGINGLGKTKASADVLSVDPPPVSALDPAGRLWAVVLDTSTLLCRPALLTRASGDSELHEAYSQVWNQLSHGALHLVRFFARQNLAGGFYVHRRFQSGNPYRPFVLTSPGSVFLLEAQAGGVALLDDWRTRGLPLPAWVSEDYLAGVEPAQYWKHCPYLPENGYGAVDVNAWEGRDAVRIL